MTQIFYYGNDNQIHGPYSEEHVQMWYVKGFFCSGVVFQISESGEFNPEHPSHTLGELIELNGRILPFHFSAVEKQSKKLLEDSFHHLKQEIESIRKASQRPDRQGGDRDIITALQAQVTSLLESHSDLVKRLDALSTQRDNSPANSQLEKRVGDLKKRVDEQEKTVTSMRKEISSLNSKCDRNDSSLQKLMEKQSSTENTVTGYEKRISDLKSSEKSIREGLRSCEQNTTSSSEQLKSITNELKKVKTDIESQKKESTSNKEGLRIVSDDMKKVDQRLDDVSDDIVELESEKDEIKKEIDALNDSIFCIQEHLNMYPSEDPSENEPENVEEREADIPASDAVKIDSKKEKKEELPAKSEVKKKEKVPDEPVVAVAEAKEKEEEVILGGKKEEKTESAPWDEKPDVAAKVEKKEELPWNSTKEVKEKERLPWDDEPAVESKVEMLPWNAKSAVRKVERAPWDDQPTVDEKVEEKEEELPWNTKKQEKKASEKAPWDEAPTANELKEKENKVPFEEEKLPWNDKKTGVEPEPWNETKTGSGTAKKEAVPTAQQAGNGLSSDQKSGKSEPVKSEKATVADVKPVSRVKDWNAICRDLSDSEEEKEVARPPITAVELAHMSDLFIRDVTELLGLYCASLDGNVQKFRDFDFTMMSTYFRQCHPKAPHFNPVREAILKELRLQAAATVFCATCDFTATTPRQLLYHLSDATHVEHMPAFLATLLPESFAEMGTFFVGLLLHFIESEKDINVSITREEEVKGRVINSRPREAECRPTVEYMLQVVSDITDFKPDSGYLDVYGCRVMPVSLIDPLQMGAYRREHVNKVKAFFAHSTNKRQFEQGFEQHMAEGVPACYTCNVHFNNVDEYYKHMTTYNHAKKDPGLFGLLMWVWKGHEYWNAML